MPELLLFALIVGALVGCGATAFDEVVAKRRGRS